MFVLLTHGRNNVVPGERNVGFNISGFIQYNKLEKEELIEVVKKAKQGDEIAFNKIVCHMHKFLMHLKDKFFIQGSDSEDVYQEGLIKLVNVIDKFDSSKGSFTPFAQQAIEKHIITCINREKAQKRYPFNNSYSLDVCIVDSSSSEQTHMTFVDNLEDSTPGEGFNPVEVVQKDYESFLVKEINKVLSSMEEKVFYLRFIEHLSYKDIAAELELYKEDEDGTMFPDQKSVDNAIMRSRPKIKKVLEKLGLRPKELSKILQSSRKTNDNNKKIKKKDSLPKRNS